MSMFTTWKTIACFAVITSMANAIFIHEQEVADMAYIYAILALAAARMACEEGR